MVTRRSVTLIAHYEWVEETSEPTWWAESDDIPGFTAVYPSLGELQRQAEDAVRFALSIADVEIDWVAGDDAPRWAAVQVEFVRPAFASDSIPAGQTLQVATPTGFRATTSAAQPGLR